MQLAASKGLPSRASPLSSAASPMQRSAALPFPIASAPGVASKGASAWITGVVRCASSSTAAVVESSEAPTVTSSPSPSGRSSSATKTERGASTKITKASGSQRRQSGGDVSLLKVPGVGRKNAQLFLAKGVATVGQLLMVHKTAHGEDIDKTKAYIQDVVGIKNKGHLSMITGFLQDKTKEQQPGSFGNQPKLTLSVEGNISAGKSTFLQILKDSGIDKHMQVVPEPVEKWQNVGKGKVNLLMEFYQDPQRFAYTFQNYVFLTRMVQERESYSQSMCRLLERSIFSDRMVFVKAVHKSKFMNDTELAIYDSWFDPMLKTLPTLVPNGFIYLRAKPETCFRRMQKRSRNEESTVELEYLEDLHQHHEDWLWSGGNKASESKYLYIPRTKQTLINPSPSSLDLDARGAPGDMRHIQVQEAKDLEFMTPEIPAALRDTLFILDERKNPHMVPQLNQIPALVLDCDVDVDVERDMEYREHVSEQVRQYTEYVRQFTKAKAGATFAQVKESEPEFNGYYLRDGNGSVIYAHPSHHDMSHAEQMREQFGFQQRKALFDQRELVL